MNDEKVQAQRFDVLWESLVVGSTELESGDPPMGVAFGRFHPSDSYVLIRERCLLDAGIQAQLRLSIRHRDGRVIECLGGVHIQDASTELGPHEIEVTALGIGYPLYKELFPQHVLAYDAMLSAKSNGSH
ncbi:hypothetical protein [Roseateles sp.]|uniref:hypothetical protein n=1 Tax=Roseateles sp. TaxID=1971397 RepID=UPI002F42D686